MKTVKKKILILALIVAMLAVPLSAVYASKPMVVQGTISPAGVPTVVTRSTPGKGKCANLVVDLSDIPQTWSGSFVGSAVAQTHWNVVKFGDEDAPGHHVSGHSFFSLDIVYDGKEGTLTIKGAHGNWRIISGTGELANLRGHGTFEIINPSIMLMSYEGVVHFDP